MSKTRAYRRPTCAPLCVAVVFTLLCLPFAAALGQPANGAQRSVAAAMPTATTGGAVYQNPVRQNIDPNETDALELTPAQKAYLSDHPTLVVAYGRSWDPLLSISSQNTVMGVAPSILNQLSEQTGVNITYVPLETASQFDILCCVPQDAGIAEDTGITLSDPYLSMPMMLITRDGATRVPSAAVDDGICLMAIPGVIDGPLRYYEGARECLDAVQKGEQPAALLNSYAARNLLQSAHYDTLQARMVNGVTVNACFGVQRYADARLLSILNRLIASIQTAELSDFIFTAILQAQPINLSLIADRMPPDVVFVVVCTAAVILALLALVAIRMVRSRKERARTAEIAAFLSYANKINDDVWEVNTRTYLRWRYRIVDAKIVRVPMPPFTQSVIQNNVHPDDLPLVLETMRHVLSRDTQSPQQHQQDRFDCRIRSDSGVYRWSRVVFQHMIPSSKHPACVMVFIMDVDDTVRSEEEKNKLLTQALNNAKSVSHAKGVFTSYISHEIRSPLNAMLGYLTLAKSSVDQPEKLQDCFVKSEYAANHLLQLINEVLDMSYIESGQLRLAQTSFDVSMLMETLASIYNAQAKSRGLAYHVETGALSDPYLIGDDLRVKQVIVNLLSNAMKFTPRGGSVTLTAEETSLGDGRAVMRFQVADTGIGMTEEFKLKLFSAYVQQDATIAAHFGGTGLGLSIAKNLLDMMGGTITVDSAQGKGTTFTVEITFPIDVSKKTLVDATPDARTCFAGRRLLLVEDNDMNMEIASELLKLEGGFEIETATNGREALEKFMQSKPRAIDAILMDVRMPVMDGYEATRAIRASDHPDAATVPILAMTAEAFDEDIRLARDAGMNGHIAKPIDFRNVLVKLSDAMRDPCQE